MSLIRHADIGDAADIGKVHAESWKATYRGIVPDRYLDAIDEDEWSERQRRNLTEAPDNVVSLWQRSKGR